MSTGRNDNKQVSFITIKTDCMFNPIVKSIIIGADKDRSGAGQASAEKLGRRFAGTGWEVKISSPPMKIPEGSSGVDWLDYLKKEVAHV